MQICESQQFTLEISIYQQDEVFISVLSGIENIYMYEYAHMYLNIYI